MTREGAEELLQDTLASLYKKFDFERSSLTEDEFVAEILDLLEERGVVEEEE